MRFLRALFVLCLFVSTNGANISWCSGGTVVSIDTSPGRMDVTVTADDLEDPEDGKIYVTMLFKVPEGAVEFRAGETVSCNGVTLGFTGPLGYAGRVARVAPGDAYNFVYTRNGTPTMISLAASEPPQFTSPMAGAMVQRSNNLTITYVADGGYSVLGDAADSATGVSGMPQKDSGIYTGLDVRKLKAGPGSLGLTRIFTGTPLRTGFNSAQTNYSVSSSIDVTWL